MARDTLERRTRQWQRSVPSRSLFLPVAAVLDRQPAVRLRLLCALLLGLAFVTDHAIGPELASSIFYVAPVALAAWYLGWHATLLVIVAAGAGSFIADALAEPAAALPVAQYWNALVRTALFLIVGRALTVLRWSLEQERTTARTDSLTGLGNHRSLLELGTREWARAQRHDTPMTLAYMDVDGFKAVNDTLGHAAGDDLLIRIARVLAASVRDIDIVARLGGDEFVLVLPELAADGAPFVVERLLRALRAVAQYGGYDVGFSVGVVTFAAPAPPLPDMLRRADAAMFDVKAAGGNRAAYHEVAGP
jgi:diguanylate cyclase (GGDEF)-like protein